MTRTSRLHPEYAEGRIAHRIERRTARLPSDTFLWLGFGSIAGAIALKLFGRPHDAQFVGEWAPVFLIMGVYNKLVKIAGSDNMESPLRRD